VQWFSYHLQDEFLISNGDKFQNAALKCWEINSSQLVAVGVNCVNPKFVSSLLRNINTNRPNNPIPLIVYPTRGETYDAQKG
jgi:homocysteine S-methyltransferase